jgi:hypothetical protein
LRKSLKAEPSQQISGKKGEREKKNSFWNCVRKEQAKKEIG